VEVEIREMRLVPQGDLQGDGNPPEGESKTCSSSDTYVQLR
jgi:hypothetical protein